MQVILDTNIWVSGLLLPNSKAGLILVEWKKLSFDVVLSTYILQEIERVLSYPKIEKRLKWDKNKIKHYVNLLSLFVDLREDGQPLVHVPDDPNDSPILSLLLSSNSDYLITGDRDLLKLQLEYPILTLNQFLEKI